MKLPKKEFTVKAWKKFRPEAQEVLLLQYDVILTDHKTRKEKITSVLRKFNTKNLNTGIDKFNKGVDGFSKSMDSLSKEMNKMSGTKRDPVAVIWGAPKKESRKKKGKKERESTTKEMFWGKSKTFSI